MSDRISEKPLQSAVTKKPVSESSLLHLENL